MYYRFGKAFYYISIIFFLFFLLYFYSALTDQVTYQMDGEGGISTIGKGNFFYGMIATFVALNALVLVPPKMLETKSYRKLHKLFPIGDNYRDYLLTWFYSFGGIINLSLATIVFYIHATNNQEEIAADDFGFFFYLIPGLLVLWIIALFLLFVGKAKQLQKRD